MDDLLVERDGTIKKEPANGRLPPPVQAPARRFVRVLGKPEDPGDARLTLTRYGHVIDELEETPRMEAEAAIGDARLAARLDEPGSVREFGP